MKLICRLCGVLMIACGLSRIPASAQTSADTLSAPAVPKRRSGLRFVANWFSNCAGSSL